MRRGPGRSSDGRRPSASPSSSGSWSTPTSRGSTPTGRTSRSSTGVRRRLGSFRAMSPDLAVLGQNAGFFGGGYESFASAFWNAAGELGRDPHLLYLPRARPRGPPSPDDQLPPFRRP